MHVAFDGGCFQQGLLGGIYQVACGFLNAAKLLRPSLDVTLVCDPRQGLVRSEAMAGLSWTPAVVYAPVARSYDPPETWPAAADPHIRFFVDGKIIPAVLEDGVARYTGPAPVRAFAILSRAAAPAGAAAAGEQSRRGVLVGGVVIAGGAHPVRIAGHDRRLSTGFVNNAGAARWTDGAGFIPLNFFPETAGEVTVDVSYTAQDVYPMAPGAGADAVLAARRTRRETERALALGALAFQLRDAGCSVYIANHFTPLTLPGMVNTAWAYDMIPLLLPQYFHSDAQVNFAENLKVFAAAARVYAISNATRTDVIEQTRVDEARVVAAGIAASAVFAPREPAAIRAVTSQFGISSHGYILVVGTVEPRKNHMRLMQAYTQFRTGLPNCPDLVIVGKMGWDYGQVLAYRSNNGLEEPIKILSDLTDDDLACLYSGALFSAYVSVYEGFGLPIVEAMACGCPVLTSDRSSMPEVAGGCAVLVNPYAVEAMASAMHDLTTNASLRTALAAQGIVRARQYSWRRSSQIILDDLQHLTGAS